MTAGAVVLCTGLAAVAQATPNGKQVAARHGCAACHGPHGAGMAQVGYPRLAGQSAAYLVAQLEAFANGKRANAIMQAQARQLSATERRAVSQYYAELKTPSAARGRGNRKQLARGREIVVNGLWQKNLPSCQACHGRGARGIAAFPALAGQNVRYIEAQLEAWQAGKRPGGPDDLMQHVAQALDAGQVHAIAAYLASLPAAGPVPAATQPDVAPAVADAMPGFFQPPLEKALPGGVFGAAVRRGYRIFTQTPKYAGRYIGNGQSCSNCHLNRGRQANASPMWAAWGMYPTYRSKNKRVNDIVMRLQGCFRYSENAPGSKVGHPPAANSPTMIALESYLYWLSRRAPAGVAMKGRGYPHLKDPPRSFSRTRGREIYAHNCALCHGPQGQGRKRASGAYAFPPLWGPKAYNWGAGMHKVNTLAAFIHHNMPLGYPGKLSLQETWDAAAWIDSQPRPQDPRFSGKLKETVEQFHHNRQIDYYGKTVGGRVLGAPGTLEDWIRKHPARH